MRTPTQAVLWELWRTSRLQLLMVVGVQFAIVLLLYSATFFAKNSDEGTAHVLCGIFVMWSTAMSAFSQSWRNTFETTHIGFSFRLGFTRPISTARMVAIPMLFIVIVAPLCYLLPAILFSWLMGLSVPLVGPAMLSAGAAACLVAVAWSPATSIGKAIGLVAFFGGLIASAAMYHLPSGNPDPFLLEIGKPDYFDFAWYQYLVLLAVPAIAMVVTVVAVERQRHGDRWQLDGLRRRWRGLNIPWPGSHRRQQPFRSLLVAQCWYEMRRFGVKLLVLSLLAPLVPFLLVTFVSRVDPGLGGAPWVWLVAVGFSPLVYQMIGADGAIGLRHKQGALQLSAFDATRALQNDQLIAIKLLVIASCSLVGWLWMGLAAGAHAALSGDWPLWVQLGQTISQAVGDVPVHWWIAGGCNVALLYISSSSFLFAFGMWVPLHPRLFACVFFAVVAHIALAIGDFEHDWTVRYLWLAEGWVLTIAIVVGSYLAVRKALSSGFLGKRLFVCMFCLWVIYVSTTIAMFLKTAPALPLTVAALGVASLLVPLASTAIAPLALASHRHR
ncbi:MAG: hypothetical protein O3C40_21685 [Planctomycetota bacterium]|nr:hypothetical protein [Planctomycetota bacterium]